MDIIIVGFVILGAIIYIARKFYLSFTGQGGCGCGSCGSAQKDKSKTGGCKGC